MDIQNLLSQAEQFHEQQHRLLDFWEDNIWLLQQFVLQTKDFQHLVVISDYIETVRGKYFFAHKHDINPIFQELCKIAIAISIKTKGFQIDNYLRYFDPTSGYALRMKALVEFRLLQNPRQEMISKALPTFALLHASIMTHQEDSEKVRDVLKEYIDKLFGLQLISQQERVQWIQQYKNHSNESVIFWMNDREFLSRLEQYDTDIWDQKTDVWWVPDHATQVIDNNKWYQDLHHSIASQEQLITQYQETIVLLEQKIVIYEQEISTLSEEKQWLIDQYEQQIQELQKKDVVNTSTSMFLDRSTYQIGLILAWPDQVGRFEKFKKRFSSEITDYWLHENCFEILAGKKGRDEQKKIDVKAKLYGSLTFIIAFTSDHNTQFEQNDRNNQDFLHRITISDKQSFSNDQMKLMLKVAIEKYERVEGNVF